MLVKKREIHVAKKRNICLNITIIIRPKPDPVTAILAKLS